MGIKKIIGNLFPYKKRFVWRENTFETIFVVPSSLCILFSWYILILAEVGLFHKSLLLAGVFTILTTCILLIKKNKLIGILSRTDYFAFFIIFLFAILNIAFVHDTFYGGRDPGVYANAAVYLSKHHNLVIDHFINFPGWIQVVGSFRPEFHLGYISWLAAHYSLFGILGVKISNFIPLIFALLSIYFISRRIANDNAGILFLVMFLTIYPIFWFTRETYSEIYFMYLIWFGILCFLIGYNEKKRQYFIPSILSFAMLLHTRIEGIYIYGIFIIIMLFYHFILKKTWMLTSGQLFLIAVTFLHFLYYSAFIHPNNTTNLIGIYYFLQNISENILLRINSFISTNSVLHKSSDMRLRYYFVNFVYVVLMEYGLSWPVLFISLSTIQLLRTIHKKESINMLLILLFVAPTFVYLFVPFISFDQPWFLRRYLPTILPTAFLFLAAFFSQLFNSKRERILLIFIIEVIIVRNLIIANPIVFHREYHGMLGNIEEISSFFSESDLILVDRYATGNYKLADPLYFIFDRYALWLGPPGDWCSLDSLHINFSMYKNIFIITNSKSSWVFQQFPKKYLQLVFERNIKYKELEKTVDLIHLKNRPADIYDLSYSVVKNMIEIPHKIREKEYLVQVYKIDQQYFKDLSSKKDNSQENL